MTLQAQDGNCLCAVLLVLTAVMVGPVQAQVSLTESPQDTEAVLGMRVLLKCGLQTTDNFTFADVDVFWRVKSDISAAIYPFYLGPNENRNEAVFPLYTFAGDQSMGEYDLEIAEVKDTHFGNYTCLAVNVEERTIVAETEDARLIHVASVAPTELACSSPEVDLTDLVEDTVFQAECYSLGGVPVPALEWTTNRTASGQTLENEYTSHLNLPARDSNATAQLSLSLSAADHLSTLVCRMDHGLGTDQCLVGPLEVKFTPQIIIEPSPTDLSPGDDLRLSCSADANPPEVTTEWVFDETISHLFEEDGAVLVILEVSEAQESIEIMCEATNSMGTREETFTITFPQKKSDSLGTNLYVIIGVVVGLVVVFLVVLAVIKACRNTGRCYRDSASHRRQNYVVETSPIQGYDLRDFEGGDNQGYVGETGRSSKQNRTGSPNDSRDSNISQENNAIVQINSL